MELIEVIDTAVKVGLGALISGITTYTVTKLNHQSDKEKEFLKAKIEMISFAMEKLEIYFNAFDKCCSRLGGMRQTGVPPGRIPDAMFIGYREIDNLLVMSRTDREIANSRLQLIALTEIGETIVEIAKIENKFREQVIFAQQLPTEDQLKSYKTEMSTLKKKVHLILSSVFERSYGK